MHRYIGKTSRKFDSDFAIYDYRKFDFGMAKFSALNLASMSDAACIVLGDDPCCRQEGKERINEEKRARGAAIVESLVGRASEPRTAEVKKLAQSSDGARADASAAPHDRRTQPAGKQIGVSPARPLGDGAEYGAEGRLPAAGRERQEALQKAGEAKEKMTLESLIDAMEQSQERGAEATNARGDALSQKRKEMKFQVLHLVTSDDIDLLPYMHQREKAAASAAASEAASGLASGSASGIPLKPPAHPLINPRLVVHVGKGVNCTLHQTFVSLVDLLPETDQQRLRRERERQEKARPAYMRGRGRGGFVNSNTRIVLEEGAELHHIYDQEQAADSWHIENLSVQMDRNSTYVLRHIDLGAQAGRFNLQVEGAESSRHVSLGLAVLNRQQEHGKYEMFHHLKPRAETSQVMKSLIGGKARAVWRGRIRIERDGVGAAAESLNRVVLLDEGSRCVAIPTLEIIPDDVVKANHGAMIRDLDTEPLFFLMSRGIDELEARKMLMKASSDLSPLRIT
ncbi:sufB/sufD domain-containing protein [Besnoitia besnoiti]|uniref:SufB/sufD domain-containing protein n=1 Tax=Besnoitia besnoiti TaxID=94643 RepID=A0A2A9MNV5_BESBE|nr:sufB/sufD domain-containing protein [Besnoitia besnoiti]PFH37402.1 sufB/sufD domain-containing protein [Besnoitia besnoiti]